MKNPHPIHNSKMFHCFTSLENETVKQGQISCNALRNKTETKSLKHLAIKVIERNKQRNNDATKSSEPETKISNDVLNHKLSYNTQEIKDSAEYLYFERLGISESEELALDEAFNHIINKLTLQQND
jgi:hypothetical protein